MNKKQREQKKQKEKQEKRLNDKIAAMDAMQRRIFRHWFDRGVGKRVAYSLGIYAWSDNKKYEQIQKLQSRSKPIPDELLIL